MKFEGRARLDKRTKDLVKRLAPGDIAFIDHVDIDRVSAESLVDAGVEVIINSARSISGRYPTVGPVIILSAGIHLIDDAGHEPFQRLKEGDVVNIEGGRILRGEQTVAEGRILTLNEVAGKMDESRSMIGEELERFAENTLEYIQRERDLLYGEKVLPELQVDMNNRHVLIVVRGHNYREDLATLSSYIREMRPVLIGVDGGADAISEAGLQPDIIVGDMDSVTNEALRSGAELIVHAYADGRCPGAARLKALGLEAIEFPSEGTSEDIAMLLAYEKGAELIVAVGTHWNLVDFLDKGRRGMSSTFLTRLKVGEILVDVKGVSRLYRSSVKSSQLVVLVAAALMVVIVVFLVASPLRRLLVLSILQLKVVFGI